jgi:Lon protease-like protein
MLENNTTIPLFPLNTVLFPGMMLPLHIFEDRYKAMINYCLDNDNIFGVVLARTKQAVASQVINIFSDDLYSVGTTAHITAVEHLRDDRMNLITIGQERFKIRTIRASADDYLIGQVDPFPLIGYEDQDVIDRMAQKLRPIVKDYIENLGVASGEDLSGAKLPGDAKSLAYLAGSASQGPLSDKQQLLTVETVEQLVAKTANIIDRENKILAYMVKAYRAHQQVQQLPFVDYSLN